MTTPYVPASFRKEAFNCPYCNAYSQMHWARLYTHRKAQPLGSTLIYQATCTNCKKCSYWLAKEPDQGHEGVEPKHGDMLSPAVTVAPMPHPDMPDNIREDYEEARLIAAKSPRGAAALLRLGIQKLCIHLGEDGKNINQDIASLVKKGLSVQIQEALDIVRVVGNNAVHPGELSVSDIAEVSNSLFELVNQIVEERIGQPKARQALFSRLPQGVRDGIKKRDGS